MKNLPGSKGAAPVWQAFMNWALEDHAPEAWPQPTGISEMTVCDTSGLLPTPFCPTTEEYFISGTEPTIYDNVYQEFKINRETGRLATVNTPPELIDSKIYLVYPEKAADWVRESDIDQPPSEYDTIDTPGGFSGAAAITSPKSFDFISGLVEIKGNAGGDNFQYYRLANFEGLTPTQLETIVDQVSVTRKNETLAVWDTSELNGLYTLLLTVVRRDGSFDEVTLPVTVDNNPPTAGIVFPIDDQIVFSEDEWIIIQAQVDDDISISSVDFFADGAEVPFAISTVPPFTEKWVIVGEGCHLFRVVAHDAAGNSTESSPVKACVVNRDRGTE
jgi:hypothetical protein